MSNFKNAPPAGAAKPSRAARGPAAISIVVLTASPAFAQSPTTVPPVAVEVQKAAPKPKKHVAHAARQGAPQRSAAVSRTGGAGAAVPVTRASGPFSPAVPGALPSSPSVGGAALPTGAIASGWAATSNTAEVLTAIPGVYFSTAGGVSGLPTIHGFADDQLSVTVDGMATIASCPNHMNPVLSYIDPTQVYSAKVWTGVAPVSVGGDAIGGSVVVNSPPPMFAAAGEALVTKASIGAFFRSNGTGLGASLSATAATEHFSLSYDGAFATSNNYNAGGAFRNPPLTITPQLSAAEVGSTAYQTQNQLATLAYQNEGQLLELKASYQHVPYQLYPNQRMDMLDNQGTGVNLRYFGTFSWGDVDSRTYWQYVDHYMNFGPDKDNYYGTMRGRNGVAYPVIGMPMYTRSNTLGNSTKADINLSNIDVLRLGLDLQFYNLDDWWPPSPDCGVGNCAGGMAPLTFWNINNGERNRYSPWLEWERQWTPTVSTVLGARYELVTTDTGPVEGYVSSTTPMSWLSMMQQKMLKSMYALSSVGTIGEFNAMDRARDFNNLDLSALVRYTPNANFDAVLGLSQTGQAPNLYELYAWSPMAMAAVMNNFLGDGNGYVGNPYLKPEVAEKVSVDLSWHSADRETEVKFSPYFSYVYDYIDAVQITQSKTGVITPTFPLKTAQFVILQYANVDARIYGFDLSVKAPIAKTAYGDFSVAGVLSDTNGKDVSLNTGLYNMMPINGKVSLIHKLGGWEGDVEFVAVAEKHYVSAERNEMWTPGYTLLNLRGSYNWRNVHFNFGVENLFNRLYYLPLGGAYVGQGMTMGINATPWGTPVPGQGRTLYAGMKVDF
jgi:iron complex outermembrane recepter protein